VKAMTVKLDYDRLYIGGQWLGPTTGRVFA
jgi:hypothetical protein